VLGLCTTQERRSVGDLVGPTADVDAEADAAWNQTAITLVVQPAAYVTRPKVMVVHVVFECCIGRSRDGQLQDTCSLVLTGELGGAVPKVPQGGAVRRSEGGGMP
jgi:hypothetical protein